MWHIFICHDVLSFIFQNTLSLNCIIQRNLDCLLGNTNRFFFSITMHFHKIYSFRNKFLFDCFLIIWYESENLIWSTERKIKK